MRHICGTTLENGDIMWSPFNESTQLYTAGLDVDGDRGNHFISSGVFRASCFGCGSDSKWHIQVRINQLTLQISTRSAAILQQESTVLPVLDGGAPGSFQAYGLTCEFFPVHDASGRRGNRISKKQA